MSDIRFSVIICAFNASKYLSECLGSLESQTSDNFEVIIIDDGSTDDTYLISEKYASSHSNTFVYRSANEGPLLARRKGLLHAKGSHILFLDADDMLRCDAIELCTREILSCDPDIFIFQSSREQGFKEASKRIRPEKGFFTDVDQIHSLVLAGNINSMWGKAFRSELFDLDRDYTAYSEVRHGEDLLQLLPVFDSSRRVLVSGEVLYYYRPNSESSTSSYRQDQRRDVLIVLKKATEYANAWGLQAVDAHAWARNITYLVTILFNDQSINLNQVKSELRVISSSIRGYFKENALRLNTLRPDYRLLMMLLIRGHYRLLKAAVLMRGRLIA